MHIDPCSRQKFPCYAVKISLLICADQVRSLASSPRRCWRTQGVVRPTCGEDFAKFLVIFPVAGNLGGVETLSPVTASAPPVSKGSSQEEPFSICGPAPHGLPAIGQFSISCFWLNTAYLDYLCAAILKRLTSFTPFVKANHSLTSLAEEKRAPQRPLA